MIELKGNRVIVRRDETQTETANGIILLKKSQKKKYTGQVVAVGSTANPKLKDKRIVFDPNCGEPFPIAAPGEHLLIFQSDIRIILNN